MRSLTLLTLVLSFVFFGSPSAPAAPGDAKAVVVKGEVSVQERGKPARPLRVGDPVQLGSVVRSGSTGRAKLLLEDQTSIRLPASSQVALDAGQVSLLEGRARFRVEKLAGTQGSRLRVRTKGSTMGVRGTDFEVVYNGQNNITSAVTYEGMVRAALNPGARAAVVRDEVRLASPLTDEIRMTLAADEPAPPAGENDDKGLLDGQNAVDVPPGMLASLNPNLAEGATLVRLSPVQFEHLKNDGGGEPGGTEGARGAPQGAQSPIAPGLDPEIVESGEGPQQRQPPTGGPVPGGFLDFNTALYIPPPPGSSFDPNVGVFIPPPNFGTIDPDSGDYKPPQGYTLDPIQGFVLAGPGPQGALPPGMPMIPEGFAGAAYQPEGAPPMITVQGGFSGFLGDYAGVDVGNSGTFLANNPYSPPPPPGGFLGPLPPYNPNQLCQQCIDHNAGVAGNTRVRFSIAVQ